MGLSSEAILAYGYSWEKEIGDVFPDYTSEDTEKDLDFFQRNISEKFPKIHLGIHCGFIEMYPFLAIKRSVNISRRGQLTYLPLGQFIPTEDEIQQLNDALEFLKATSHQSGPVDFLASWVGW